MLQIFVTVSSMVSSIGSINALGSIVALVIACVAAFIKIIVFNKAAELVLFCLNVYGIEQCLANTAP